mmetsp:Transcript_58726/g.187333  ORF Transcript_58726/g.187333 Transcript_58726/m.187333 type:complete len:250 (-) Transcript_58726:328-1077(-)
MGCSIVHIHSNAPHRTGSSGRRAALPTFRTSQGDDRGDGPRVNVRAAKGGTIKGVGGGHTAQLRGGVHVLVLAASEKVGERQITEAPAKLTGWPQAKSFVKRSSIQAETKARTPGGGGGGRPLFAPAAAAAEALWLRGLALWRGSNAEGLWMDASGVPPRGHPDVCRGGCPAQSAEQDFDLLLGYPGCSTSGFSSPSGGRFTHHHLSHHATGQGGGHPECFFGFDLGGGDGSSDITRRQLPAAPYHCRL